jgi:hypothetical protein
MKNLVLKQTKLNGASFVYRDAKVGESIKVEVDHEQGGTSMWSGSKRERGVTVTVSVTTLEQNEFEGRTYMTECFTIGGGDKPGYYITALPLPRRSDKKTERVAKAVDEIAPQVAAAFRAGERQKSIDLLRGVLGL